MNHLRIINGFLLSKNSTAVNDFEDLYISLRQNEGRLFSEKEIPWLPKVSRSHPHFKEWKIRENSCHHLLNYIKKKGHICNILEVGCGNGWLSAKLSSVTKAEVTGVDINRVELSQAKKAFARKQNVRFIYGDIRNGILGDKKFDLIIFAASVQYFKSLKEIIKNTLPYLTLQGEIHILDSPFYSGQEVIPATQRTKQYFSAMGFGRMSQFYFHHTLHELASFNYTILFNPRSWINQLLFRKNPFHWIVIRNHYT